jgi:hypothetical protein
MRLTGSILLLTIVGWSCAFAGTDFELTCVASRPDTVSSGDALVQLRAPQGSKWVALLNGRDVTQSFKSVEGSAEQRAFLTGLAPRRNVVEIRSKGKLQTKLELIDHPRQGPIFSGPHQEPFVCQTVDSGLGPATNEHCEAETVVSYYYRTTEPLSPYPLPVAPAGFRPGFKPYPAEGPPPSDMAKTTLADGRVVNYVVRRELGTINRAIYDIQFLHEPGQPLPTPWQRSGASWNGRLVYNFGGGCDSGYHQGKLSGGFPDEEQLQEPVLAQGYALATSSLNIFGTHCNDRVSAETLSMVKEHFIESYGVPVHTMGWGGSGGAIQQHLIAQNYPGLLDGIVVFVSFPDIVTYVQISSDCSVLDRAFRASTRPWADEQKTAVSGFATWHTCRNVGSVDRILWVDPLACDSSTPKDSIYDARTNPKGVRCDLYSNEINVFGSDPRTGRARRPLDNVGVQYGLAAFNNGAIDAEQFIELNERAGGFDQDGHLIAARTEADPEAIRLAYERGLVVTGGGDLGRIPIIDWRAYTDDQADNHDYVRPFVMRARLTAANGQADNQVVLVYPPIRNLSKRRELELVQHMDRWLDNVAADTSSGSPVEKLIRGKPAELAEGCWRVSGEKISERLSHSGSGKCHAIYPPHADPRIVAGAPLTNDVLKCALKPVTVSDYAAALTVGQLERLRTIFPKGVCDYSRPGVGQEIASKVWQRF